MEQTEMLMVHLRKNILLMDVLDRSQNLGIPNWFVGAGFIANTVWNSLCGNEINCGVKDIDWVYFDDSDLTEESENKKIQKVKEHFRDIPIDFDVKNQARVHLWYEKKFGYSIQPYKSIQAAIDTWPTTSTAIALKYDLLGKLEIYAPYGVNDLLEMTLKPNKRQITNEIYQKKVNRWLEKWPKLKIIDWEDAP